MVSEQQVADLRVQVTTTQGNHKESMDQLADRGKQIVALKMEQDRLGQQNQTMQEEVRGNRVHTCICIFVEINNIRPNISHTNPKT